jgi:FixJ family two-component response regulator
VAVPPERDGHAATVFVVDDDAAMREALSSLLRSIGWQVKTFATAAEFLAHSRPPTPACLVLDVRLPGLSGLDLQRTLSEVGVALPIIFMTGHGDVPMSVQAMKAGAVEFLSKPFREEDLLSAIRVSLERDAVGQRERGELAGIRERIASLSHREREVMQLIVQGLLNKQVGAALDISEVTVKVHRRRVMNKMGAHSLPELVRMVEKGQPSSG